MDDTCIMFDAGSAVQMNSIIITVSISVSTSYWQRADDAHWTTTWEQTVSATKTFTFTRAEFTALNLIQFVNGTLNPDPSTATPMDVDTYALLRTCDRAWPQCISPDNRNINWVDGVATIDGNALNMIGQDTVDDNRTITYTDPDEIPDTDPVEYYEMPDDETFDGPYMMTMSAGLFCDPMFGNASNPKHAYFGLNLGWTAGDGATGTAAVAGGLVTDVNIGAHGSGYIAGAIVLIEGDGSGATASPTINALGEITALTLDSPGTGYTYATVRIVGNVRNLVEFSPDRFTTDPVEINIMTLTRQGGGNDFGGTISASKRSPGIESTDINVIITPCGFGATAHVTIVAGVVTNPTVDSGGPGGAGSYTYGAFAILDGSGLGAPLGCITDGTHVTSVFLDDDGGSGWGPIDAEPFDVALSIYPIGEGSQDVEAECIVIGGGLNAVNVINGGNNYWTGAVGVVKGMGAGATVRVVCEGGVVTKVIVVNPGHDYPDSGTYPTRIRIFGNPCGPVQSLELIGHPGVFSIPPSVIFYGANLGGSGAAGTASIDEDGLVDTVSLTSGGHGYTGVNALLYSPVVPGQTVDNWDYEVSISAEVT